ncbi:MAG: hypothetical protein K8S55_12305 [Phycisphaerae bacterium]|nr:hypothetical protein [Phycisphaerae bacterium]
MKANRNAFCLEMVACFIFASTCIIISVTGCSTKGNRKELPSVQEKSKHAIEKSCWQKVTIELPNNLGKLIFLRRRAHPFLAEYDRKVITEDNQGTKTSFKLPGNLGGRTNIKIYLIAMKGRASIWLHDIKDKSAYVFDTKKPSFEIKGEYKYWKDSTQGIFRGGYPVEIPENKVFLGTINRDGWHAASGNKLPWRDK